MPEAPEPTTESGTPDEYFYEKWEKTHDELGKTINTLNATYRERAQLVALLAALYPSHVGPAPDEPGWSIVYIQLPTGQASWHIAKADMHLFSHVETTASDDAPWDGHTADQKYRRIRDLIDAIEAGEQPRGAYRPADPDAQVFEVGKFYITANQAFVFQCNQVTADGLALGPELRVDGLPCADRRYVYLVPGTRDLWSEIDEDKVHAAYGEAGWVHPPKARPTAGN